MRRFDHRSPIQPGSSKGWMFAAGIALAVMAWGLFQQYFPHGTDTHPQERDSPQATGPSGAGPATRAKANLVFLFDDDDYPVDAIRRNEQGTVSFRLSLDDHGRPLNCTIDKSSGSKSLDDATCRILQTRTQATPARDAKGHPIPDELVGRIKWVLPED